MTDPRATTSSERYRRFAARRGAAPAATAAILAGAAEPLAGLAALAAEIGEPAATDQLARRFAAGDDELSQALARLMSGPRRLLTYRFVDELDAADMAALEGGTAEESALGLHRALTSLAAFL